MTGAIYEALERFQSRLADGDRPCAETAFLKVMALGTEWLRTLPHNEEALLYARDYERLVAEYRALVLGNRKLAARGAKFYLGQAVIFERVVVLSIVQKRGRIVGYRVPASRRGRPSNALDFEVELPTKDRLWLPDNELLRVDD